MILKLPRRSRGLVVGGLLLFTFLLMLFVYSKPVGFRKETKATKAFDTRTPGWLDVQKRVAVLRERCQEIEVPTPSSDSYHQLLNRLLVVDEHKWIFCDVARCGSTHLKRLAYILSGKSASNLPEDIKPSDARWAVKPLADYSETEIKKRLEEYKKVMVTRDPLERVLSAYRSNKINSQTENLTFTDFLDKVFKKNVSYLRHTATYSYLCKPCNIEYDFIGALPTFERDMELLLDWLGARDLVAVQTGSATLEATNRTTSDVQKRYYKDIPNSRIREIWGIYHNDYFLFDYPFPQHLLH